MRTGRLLAAAVLPLLAAVAAPTTAHADGGYATIGVGMVPDVGGDIDALFGGEDRSAMKIGGGYRWDKLAIEGSLFGANLHTQSRDPVEWTTTSLGVEVKYFIPIVKNLEGVVHGGLHKTWLGMERGESLYNGSGTLLGLGAQYNFVVKPLKSAAVWLDYTRQGMKTSAGSAEINGSIGMLSLGLTIGF